MQIETVVDNLKDILSCELGESRVYDKDVAHALGISKESLCHHKRKNTIPYESIVYFCAKRQISINWVLFNQLPKSLEAHTEPYVAIKYFKEIHASAGGGSLVDESLATSLYLSKNSIQTLFKTLPSKDTLQALHVKGDSMEPTLEDEDLVLIQKGEKYNYRGEIYILENNSGLMVKRLIQRDNCLEIHSDNLNYQTVYATDIEAEDITIYGKVLAKLEKP